MTNPIPWSEGLRQYHDLCVKPAPSDVVGGLWRVHSGWVGKHVSQDALIAVYLELLRDLDPAPDEIENALLDACEIVWYALTPESLKRVEAAIDEKCRVEDPERYKLRQAARARVQPLVTPEGGGNDNSTR